MTLWRLDKPDEARAWFQRAEACRLREGPDDLELLRFVAEARSVIGGPTPAVADATPITPSTIAEALENPWFGLPKHNLNGDAPAGPEGKDGKRPADGLRVQPRHPVSRIFPSYLPWKQRPRIAA
jgi:hypothetical protein